MDCKDNELIRKTSHEVVIVRDERTVSPAALMKREHGAPMSFADTLPDLVSPDTGEPLRLNSTQALLFDLSGNRYPFRSSLPLLVPSRLQTHYTDRLSVPHNAVTDAFLQYYYLSSIKQSGDINASANDIHYQRHLYRMQEFMTSASGKILDVGCDDPAIGASLLPVGTYYIGLDPFCVRLEPFRIIGVGEQLPFRDASFDAVLFNTSLDHIFDWRRAIYEASRVLKAGGILYVCTLIWTDRADLISDSVHFHHFRDYEIFGALQDWEIVSERRYNYKDANHRHGLYLAMRKPNLSGSGS